MTVIKGLMGNRLARPRSTILSPAGLGDLAGSAGGPSQEDGMTDVGGFWFPSEFLALWQETLKKQEDGMTDERTPLQQWEDLEVDLDYDLVECLEHAEALAQYCRDLIAARDKELKAHREQLKELETLRSKVVTRQD